MTNEAKVAEIRERIADMVYRKLMFLLCGDDTALSEGHTSSAFAKNVADSILTILKDSGLGWPGELLSEQEIQKVKDRIYSGRLDGPLCTLVARATTKAQLAQFIKLGDALEMKK